MLLRTRFLELRTGDVHRRPECKRHNRQHGIEATICYVKRTVNYEEVIMIVYAAPFVRHGSFRIMAHATCAGLVLPSAQSQSRAATPNPFAAARSQPLLTARAHELGSRDRRRVRRPTQTRDRDAPAISHALVDGDAPFWTRYVPALDHGRAERACSCHA
jgi:hypothetical protein